VIYFGSRNITLKPYDTVLVAEEKGKLLNKRKRKKNKKGNKKMIDQEIFEELSESLNGNYALEAKVLAAIMPTGW
jgi:hypothetical protein